MYNIILLVYPTLCVHTCTMTWIPALNCRVAAVLSFFSNEQTFQVLTNLQMTGNSVVGDTVNYISDTFRELVELICQLASDGGVARSILTEVEGN